jgi:4-amino-4-deoxy-L-arabinose transferase-like glycosyltransferase
LSDEATIQRRALPWAGLGPALGPATLAVAFVVLASWSWRKWTDVQIDFGNQLYIPWQLSDGKALYRDIAHRNGPLSHYVGALAFLLFGVSLRTLVLCNLAVLAASCAMTYRVFRDACGRLTATAVGLVLLCVFGFSQYVGAANYNYVTPYQQAQTHGLALSLAMLLAFSAYFRRRRLRWCALAGGCLGLVLLTKAELAVPAAAAAGAGLFWSIVSEPIDGRRLLRLGSAFLGAALFPVAGAFALLALQMPAEIAWGGVLGNWNHLGSDLLADRFYLRGAGLDDVAGNLWHALRMLAAIAGVAGAAALLDRLLPVHRARAAWSAAAGVAVFAVLCAARDAVPWFDLPRALPLVTLAAVVVLAIGCWRRRDRPEALARWAPLALWALWSLLLLGKMPLHTRIHHYGFALAMPATLLLVATFVHGLPAWGRARSGGDLTRAVGLASIAAGVVFLLLRSDSFYARKDFRVGQGADAIVVAGPGVDPRGALIARALTRLEAAMPADASLLVMPEGIGLNYWLRRRNPTRFNLFLPAELRAFGGEEAMLEEIREHAPDFVVLMHRDSAEFGVGPFGEDPRNGRRLRQWVDANYIRLTQIGAEPFRDRRFGLVILRRRQALPSVSP